MFIDSPASKPILSILNAYSSAYSAGSGFFIKLKAVDFIYKHY